MRVVLDIVVDVRGKGLGGRGVAGSGAGCRLRHPSHHRSAGWQQFLHPVKLFSSIFYRCVCISHLSLTQIHVKYRTSDAFFVQTTLDLGIFLSAI